MNLLQGYVLMAGMKDIFNGLKSKVPNLCNADTGFGALRQIREKSPTVLLGLWDLEDMPDGELFRMVQNYGYFVATVAIVDFGDIEAELSARSLGVSAVFDTNTDVMILTRLLRLLTQNQKINVM
ncbi:MAG: hypothetical protein WC962_04370 [Phycisphaerae bacterium]|jgi:hypothetical protein